MAIIKSGTPGNREQAIDALGTSLVSFPQIPQGATLVQFKAINFTAANAEGLLTLTPTRDFVESATGTTFGVTAGKRLRLLRLIASVQATTAAVNGFQARLRVNPGGAAVIASPVVSTVSVESSSAVIGAGGSSDIDLGLELSGSAQLAISARGAALAGNDIIVTGYEYTPLT